MESSSPTNGRPIRIVMVGTRGFPNVQGGVEKHCEQLAVNLVKLGCEMIVLTRRPYVDHRQKAYKGVMTVALPAIRQKSMEAFFHTLIGIFYAIKYQPDILHIQAIGPALFAPLGKAFRMTVVVTSHGSNYEHIKWGKLGKLVLRLGEFCGVRFADRLIAVSERIGGEIANKYGRTPVVIPNGVQVNHYSKECGVLLEYGLTRERYILAVGRLVPEKGFEVLVDAFGRLDMADWKLVIAGAADHESDYSRKLSEQASRVKNVVLTGYLDDRHLSELYRHAGLFVLPSYYEGLPITLLEALGHGLSCIASNIKGNRAIPLEEERYFEPGDSHALGEKIRHYIHRPLSGGERSRQSRRILRNYDWEAIAVKTLEVYGEAMGTWQTFPTKATSAQ